MAHEVRCVIGDHVNYRAGVGCAIARLSRGLNEPRLALLVGSTEAGSNQSASVSSDRSEQEERLVNRWAAQLRR